MKKFFLALALIFVPVSNLSAQLLSQIDSPDTNTSELISPETGVDYTKLRDLLANKNWRKANARTGDLIMQATGREDAGWLNVESIQNFPCWDIGTMDRLWKEYSNDRFGFSIQFPIFLSTGNIAGRIDPEAWDSFGDQVGWREGGTLVDGGRRGWKRTEDLTFNLSAPMGHLPNPRYSSYSIYGSRLPYTLFFKRARDCKIPGFEVNQ